MGSSLLNYLKDVYKYIYIGWLDGSICQLLLGVKLPGFLGCRVTRNWTISFEDMDIWMGDLASLLRDSFIDNSPLKKIFVG